MTRETVSEIITKRQSDADAALGKGLFAFLRELEQNAGGKPRIGTNLRLRDSLVRLGQDPFLCFPGSDLAGVDTLANPPRVRAQFLGFFGGFGALPLAWTEEAKRWFDAGDDSFSAFTDIFAARFQELFFRTWSDSHAISQFDHPEADRFSIYLLRLLGTGTPSHLERGALPDNSKCRLASLAMGRVKSAVKLRQMLEVQFRDTARFRIEENVPVWLDFDDSAVTRLGDQASSMGEDLHLGPCAQTLSEKITVNVEVNTREAYALFLPGERDHEIMADLITWYLGQTFEVEIALWLPEPEITPAVLGTSTQIGWMACIDPDAHDESHRTQVTRFDLEPKLHARTAVF